MDREEVKKKIEEVLRTNPKTFSTQERLDRGSGMLNQFREILMEVHRTIQNEFPGRSRDATSLIRDMTTKIQKLQLDVDALFDMLN